ncbi:MAG: hypothetical protein ACJA2R_000587 [Saprospiraceae bacterium]|jgi:hypothetical protein
MLKRPAVTKRKTLLEYGEKYFTRLQAMSQLSQYE